MTQHCDNAGGDAVIIDHILCQVEHSTTEPLRPSMTLFAVFALPWFCFCLFVCFII